ncbi:MAG: tRNA (adenosine(37)-N6)-threonylcarbamoyltransferase complex dimerization subunit type 1 TsaB [Leifsonia sp.]
MLLAIDTSAGTSVAVVDRDGGILAESGVPDTMRHAEVVGRLIEDVLAASGVRPGTLSGVVAGMGPGPFTGLRVGIAAARTFAFAIGRPVVPIVSHDAVAWQHYRDGGSGAVAVVTDARRREVFWSTYSGADEHGLPVRVDGPSLARPDSIDFPGHVRLDAAVIPAGALGMVAEIAFANGRPFAADEPIYLRSPDVTISAGPKRVTR